jgi:hypothetical protein
LVLKNYFDKVEMEIDKKNFANAKSKKKQFCGTDAGFARSCINFLAGARSRINMYYIFNFAPSRSWSRIYKILFRSSL